jgi:hypothetical protein
LSLCFLGEGVVEYTGNHQDGNLNVSSCTDSEETEISKKYGMKKKTQNGKKDSTSDSKNKGPTRKGTKGTWIDSDSDIQEICHSSLARTVENAGLESSISSTATGKVKSVILDSDFETNERSLTGRSSRNVLLDSNSENEDMEVGPQENKYRSKRVLSGSDSDSDGTSHCKRSRAIFSVDTNTMGTELQHLHEETNGGIYVQKHTRRIIVSDEEDD